MIAKKGKKKCAKCKSGQKQSTVEELKKYQMVKDSVRIITINNERYLQCAYPVMGDAPALFAPELSNKHSALAKSKSLFH